jgi:Glycosyltransferase family 87
VVRLRLAVAWAAVIGAVLFAQTWTRAQRPGGIDLTSYLLSADVLRHGGSPYLLPTPFPYRYPATLAFLLIPLTFVSASVALVTWFALNAMAAVWSIRSLARAKVPDTSDTVVFLAVFFTLFFTIVQSNLRNGQVNFLVLALCAAAAIKPGGRTRWVEGHLTAAPAAMPSRGDAKPRRGISERSRRGWGPGASEKKLACWWSLAVALKLVPLVLTPYFLFRRSWLWLLVSVALIAVWCLLPAAIVGARIVDIYQQFWSVLTATSLAPHVQPLDFSLAGTLAWITGAPLTTALKASAAAVVLGWIMRVDARRLRAQSATGQPVIDATPVRDSDLCAFALYLLSIPLLSPQSEVHHLAFALPAAAIVGSALWWEWARATTALRVAAIVAAGLYLAATATGAFAGPLFCASLIAFGVAVMKTLPKGLDR